MGWSEKTRLRAYAMWNFVKYVGAAAILTSMAISRETTINSLYLESGACTLTYAEALANPNIYYEFGLCSFQWTPGLVWLKNLMTDGGQFSDFGSASSAVGLYIWYAGIAFGIIAVWAAVMGLLTCATSENRNPRAADWSTMLTNLIFVVLLMAVANEIFQLYLYNGLYVSAWGHNYMIIAHALTLTFVAVFFVYWIVESFTEASESCNAFMLCLIFLLFSTFTIFSVVLSIVSYRSSGDPTHVVINCLLFLSLLEIPYCLCSPGIRKVFTGLHDFRPVSQEEAAEARQERYREEQDRREREVAEAVADFD